MKTRSIELPLSFDVASRGKVCTVDIAQLGDDMIAQLFFYGLQQKIADSASSAGTQAAESHFGKAQKEVPNRNNFV